ncbi:hypothetical protein, partial [Natrinema soli]
MFDEWRTRFSTLSNQWIRLARGPLGLVRTFSDWGPPVPVRLETGPTDSSTSVAEDEYARTARGRRRRLR